LVSFFLIPAEIRRRKRFDVPAFRRGWPLSIDAADFPPFPVNLTIPYEGVTDGAAFRIPEAGVCLFHRGPNRSTVLAGTIRWDNDRVDIVARVAGSFCSGTVCWLIGVAAFGLIAIVAGFGLGILVSAILLASGALTWGVPVYCERRRFAELAKEIAAALRMLSKNR
jgi:hypothetical protein